MNRKIFIFTLFATLIFAGITCIPGCSDEEELTEVTLLLDWTPNTNYSGIFTAIEEGYYRQENLKVEVIEAPGSVVQMVGAGQAEFGISYQEEVTLARLSEIPVISIAAIIQHNTSGFASLSNKEIISPADFAGKSYGGWGSPVEEAMIKALMKNYSANFNEVEIITTGEVDSLIVMEREADFAWIYYGWTGIEAELKGVDLNFIELRMEEPALDYYTPVIITSEKIAMDHQALAEKFMRATSAGYELAIKDPGLAADNLLKHAPELNEELVRASQEWLAKKYKEDAEIWGVQKKEKWENYSQWLYDYGLINSIPDINKAFTNRFLE